MINNFYSYILEEDDSDVISYSFLTSNRSVYYVYFDPYEYVRYTDNYPHLLESGFAFGFQRIIKGNGPWISDLKIGETISRIVIDFIKEHGADVVLLYHCDYSDKKQRGRDKIFNDWYECSAMKQSFIKKKIAVIIVNKNGGVIDYYMGYLTSKNNSLSQNVEDEFSLFAENLASNKP